MTATALRAPGYGIANQYRPTVAQDMVLDNSLGTWGGWYGFDQAYSYQIKMTRIGDTLASAYSTDDGASWIDFPSHVLPGFDGEAY
ncbi:hypothetical protein LCGC14_1735150, partial [marine sediment metagenome]